MYEPNSIVDLKWDKSKESYLDFCSRVLLNYKVYGFENKRQAVLKLTGEDMIDNSRKLFYGLKNINKAVLSGHANEFLKSDEQSNSKGNRVLVIADIHAPFTLKGYLEFCKKMYDKWDCNIVVFIGDILDNHASSYHESDPDGMGAGHELSKAEKIISEFYSVFPNAKVCLGNHDCYDDMTEVLTENGWVKGVDLTEGVKVGTMNLATSKLEYQLPTDIIKRKHIGEMFNYKNVTNFDISVTPNHRLVFAEKDWGANGRKYKIQNAYKVVQGRKLFPITCDNNNSEYSELNDDELALIGLLGSDGSILEYGVLALYQSKQEICDKIEGILNRLNIDYKKNSRNRDITQICGVELKSKPMTSHEYHFKYDKISKIYKDKYILPKELDLLSKRQFDIFINSYIDGDGSRKYLKDGTVKNGCCIYGIEPMLEQLQILCIKNSISAHINEYREGDFRLNLTFDKKNIGLNIESDLSVEFYEGDVWCATAPNTTLVIRRNGKVSISGNCLPNRKSYSSGLSNRWIKPISEVINTPNWEYKESFIIDGVEYCHGTGRQANSRMKDDNISVVQGHWHSKSYIEFWQGKNGIRNFAMQVGSGIEDEAYAFAYGKNFPRPHINVGIIIDGKLPIIEYMN